MPRLSSPRPRTTAPSPRLLLGVLSLLGMFMGAPAAAGAAPPTIDSAFWRLWGDGRAEISTYDVQVPRYGDMRQGVAVAIFVTETFLSDANVKSNRHTCCAPNELPVMKLNLVTDFPAGIYDYNLMTTAFVALAPHRHLTVGSPVKITFSAQEWCGQVYQQAIFHPDRTAVVSHSYFQGEADEAFTLPRPDDGLSEDTLLLWARGFAGPSLSPGEKADQVPLLRSLTWSRLQHHPLRWATASLSRDAAPETITVPAGTFEVDRFTARYDDVVATIHVERVAPRRVVRWSFNTQESGELVASERIAYWKHNRAGGEQLLPRIGLSPRPPRTP